MAISRTLTFEGAVWTVNSHLSAGNRGLATDAPPAWLEFSSLSGERRVSPGVGPFTQTQLDGFTPNRLLEWLLLAEPRPTRA